MGQHYIPQRYLRGFLADGAKDHIWMYDKQQDSFKFLPISQVAQARGFYEEEIENADSLPTVKATEEWFEFELAGITITGRMDRVDSTPDGLVILDYKTGNSKDEDAAKKSLQLSVYALAAKHKFGAPVAQVGFYNLETTQFISVPRTDKDLQSAEKEIKKVADGIRAENFEPKPGFQCDWCGYGTICPAKREMLPQLATPAVAH